jgi:hypothetical protein
MSETTHTPAVPSLIPTLITARPDAFQAEHWATRDGVPFRTYVLSPADVTEAIWLRTPVLVVDVRDLPLLDSVFGRRQGFTILVGRGREDELDCVRLWQDGRCNASARLDEFDSRSALLVILDRFRTGRGDSVIRVLGRE